MFSLSTTFRRVIDRVLNRLLNRYNSRHALIPICTHLGLPGRIIGLALSQSRVSFQVRRTNQASSLLSRTVQGSRLVIA